MSEKEKGETFEHAVPVFFIPFVPVATEIFLIVDDFLTDVPGLPFQERGSGRQKLYGKFRGSGPFL